MKASDAKNRIERLRLEIEEHNRRYYLENRPVISDFEYDLLLNEETARYIFRAVAYKLVITDPVAYGFNISKDDLYPELKYYEVKVDTAVKSFSAFADKFGTNYKLLKFLFFF